MKNQNIIIKCNLEFKAITEKNRIGFMLDNDFIPLDLITFPKNLYGFTNISYMIVENVETAEKYQYMIEWFINNCHDQKVEKKLNRAFNKIIKAQEHFAILESE